MGTYASVLSYKKIINLKSKHNVCSFTIGENMNKNFPILEETDDDNDDIGVFE